MQKHCHVLPAINNCIIQTLQRVDIFILVRFGGGLSARIKKYNQKI